MLGGAGGWSVTVLRQHGERAAETRVLTERICGKRKPRRENDEEFEKATEGVKQRQSWSLRR